MHDWRIGPAVLGLDLTVAEWTADFLLALFFFLAGLELKVEFTVGELRSPRQALVPVAAAVGGMAAPVGVYLLLARGVEGAAAGWAVPTATDIAFALAVLAIVGRHLPGRLRTFLLTLAVVDDLLAIVIIALFFSHDLDTVALVASVAVVAAFAVTIRRWRRYRLVRWVALPTLALIAWALMHHSGVHATIAGVLLGFAVPVLGRNRYGTATPPPDIAHRIDSMLRPISAGFAVPLFAFFAAGVTIGGSGAEAVSALDRIPLAVAGGLIIGKAIGIGVTTEIVGRLAKSTFTRRTPTIDVVGLAILGGVGFTVSLLIGQLAFSGQPARIADAQLGVLVGSVLSAAIAGVILGLRSRRYRRATSPTDGGSHSPVATQRVEPDDAQPSSAAIG